MVCVYVISVVLTSHAIFSLRTVIAVVYALNDDLEVMWHFQSDKNTGHFPFAIDINGDGHDELLVGYNMLDCHGNKCSRFVSRVYWAIRGYGASTFLWNDYKFHEALRNGLYSNKFEDVFNKEINAKFDGVRDYIVCHYKVNQRKDTDYWRDNFVNTKVPDNLNNILYLWRTSQTSQATWVHII